MARRDAANQFRRFVLTGPIGVTLGALQYELVWFLNPLEHHRAWTSWVVSSAVGVLWIHALHRRFTFGGAPTRSYRSTIAGAFGVYSTTLFLGAALVHVANAAGVQHTLAWLLATAVTSVVNFLALRRLLVVDADEPAPARLRASDVTVVVPTKDERHNVGALLASLPADVPLILVDASSDDTAGVARSVRPRHTRVIKSSAHIAEARQIGADQAETPWVLFSDADVTFDERFFERLSALEPTADVACVYGTKAAHAGYRWYYVVFRLGQRLFDTLGIPAASGSNLLVRRDALMAVGGFDCELTCNEDSEIAWRVRRAGHVVRFAPELVVYERDQRRLHRGPVRKIAHSVARCTLLYLDVVPRRWSASDWGYWR